MVHRVLRRRRLLLPVRCVGREQALEDPPQGRCGGRHRPLERSLLREAHTPCLGQRVQGGRFQVDAEHWQFVHAQHRRAGRILRLLRRHFYMGIHQQYVALITRFTTPVPTLMSPATDLEGVKYDIAYWGNRAGTIAASQMPLVTALGTKNNVLSCE